MYIGLTAILQILKKVLQKSLTGKVWCVNILKRFDERRYTILDKRTAQGRDYQGKEHYGVKCRGNGLPNKPVNSRLEKRASVHLLGGD